MNPRGKHALHSAAKPRQASLRRNQQRRVSFSGRTAPEGLSLEDHSNVRNGAFSSEAENDTLTATEATSSSTVEPTPDDTDSAPDDAHYDSDLAVDGLDLGTKTGRFRRMMGRRISAKLGPSAQYIQRSFSFLRTSPGKLSALSLILIVAILAAGLSMWQTMSQRQEKLAVISEQTEPMAHSAQNLYASLTIANAAANTAFSRGTLSGETSLRDTFDNAIAQASMSATRAATGIDNVYTPEMDNIATVQRLIPVYTAMVESGRANAHQGNPVGVAYLASASSLMRDEILPAARNFYTSTSRATNEQQASMTSIPLVPLSGLLAAVIMLLAAQWYLTRKNGRLFNPGLIIANALMALTFLGIILTTGAPWRSQSLQEATMPVHPLTEVRISAQQLRSVETLNLVRRQPADSINFNRTIDEIHSTLSDVADSTQSPTVEEALTQLDAWKSGHERMQRSLDTGKYYEAVTIATDESAPDSSEAAFANLDRALQQSINDTRETLRIELDEVRRASAALALMTVTITIIAAVLVAVGFRERLLEYL